MLRFFRSGKVIHFHFTSFRTRLFFFFIILLIFVEGSTLLFVTIISQRSAREVVDQNLMSTANLFTKFVDDRNNILIDKARLLSSDFAFKQAFAIQEKETLVSALENHKNRVRADLMMLLSFDGEVIADTLHLERQTQLSNTLLIEKTMNSETGEIQSIELFDNAIYQIALVPLFTPEPSALIIIGFFMNNQFADYLKQHTDGTEVSILRQVEDDNWHVIASTLDTSISEQLPTVLSHDQWAFHQNIELSFSKQRVVSLIVPYAENDQQVVVILLKSLDKQLASYYALRESMLYLFAATLLGSLVLSNRIAGSVVKPVTVLEKAARHIANGNFNERVEVNLHDEIGRLANTFNFMSSGLQERDKIRDLLGKVVSTEIAQELMSKEIELGGEEKEVTILFSDIRKFTTLCENRTPKQIIALINRYLTGMNEVIDKNSGVVEQYVGDAVMALFGAPLPNPQSAANAVHCALEMFEALNIINSEFSQQGIPTIKIGVGINTDIVLVGNVGSSSRLNYTVIGDGVNLASRLEGLTKFYGVNIIVSNETKAQTHDIIFRELDNVKVKGKENPVLIYEPICRQNSNINKNLLNDLHQYEKALNLYKLQQWQQAYNLFQELEKRSDHPALYQLYMQRVRANLKTPPGKDWDGIFIHTSK